MKSYSAVRKLGRSAVSILLSVCMLAFLLPLNVWAEEIGSEDLPDGLDGPIAVMEAEEEKEIIVEEEIETSRDAFTKELVKGSGAHFYAVFPLAVHYEEGDGEEEKVWKEIDNTLQKMEEGYANTAGAWEVALPEDPSAEPVSVTYNGHTLRYSLTELQPSSSEVLDVSLDPEEGSLQAQTIPKGFASAIEYPEALPEGTLRYDLVSHQLKESVVYNSLPEVKELTYVLTGEDLSVELNEDNTLSVSFGGELAFIWEAPYLYDAEGFPCFDVQTTVTATEEGYAVTYSLPEEWLTAEERAFPVTFDPVVHPDILISNTQDQTVFTNKTEPYTWGMVECGRYSGYGVSRCYIKYETLPTLTSADVITRAEMSLYKLQQSTEQAQINVHKVLGAWNDATLNWSNKPAYDPIVEDYRLIYNLGWYTWEVTDIARSWYTEGNHGMMFKSTDAIENGSSNNWKQFCSSDYGGAVMPVLYLTFINNCGIESSWDYEETGAGRAGTGYVSDFTGNLVWVRDEMGFSGQRMPVTVERIYNANDKDDNRFGMGYGWRTNFNQLVYQWSTDSSYYVWEDEDGTRQYFKYKSSGTYEDERGTGLVLTTTGSGNSKYTITDRQNNKRTFDTNGRLYQIRNNQATVSTITVAYTTTSGKLIDTVTDGAGRIYKFTYSSSLVTNLTFKGSNSGSYYSVNYNYSSYRFMGATYPDGKTISYTYNGSRLLTTATDVDGYKVTYGYSSTAPYRVTSIAVSDDGTQGGTLALSYAHNETTLTDHNNNREIMQFTDWGNTVCIQDDEMKAVFARYAEEDTNGDRKKADQMTLDSRLQDTIVNKLACGSFEFGSRWTGASDNPSTGSWAVSTEQQYIGQKSMKITSSSTTPFMVTPTNALSLASGKTYTLSAWVKTNTDSPGAQLRVYTGTTLTAQTDPIAANSPWQRVQVTFTCTSAANTKVYLVNAASGTVYFDCVQLEQSTSAGRYNMIENGDMRYTDSGYTSNAYGWSSTTPALTWGRREVLSESPGALMGVAAYRITGQANTYVQAYQQIMQGGSAGDCYVMAGWAKGDSVPVGSGRNTVFALVLKFNYTDGTTENFRLDFNPDADTANHWQYGAGRAVPKKAYSSMYLCICYDYNANTGYFDGIQVFREEYGNSYVYDSEGRITSVTDLQKQVTSYEYSNNDLVKAVTKEGNTEKAKVTYIYDSYHNVLKATTLEGVVTSFTYDNYGNNIKVERGSVNAQATFTNSGNTLSTVRDTQGNVTTYGYNAQTGVLTYVQRPGENSSTRTNYTYDSLWRNTSISKQNSNNQTTSNSYTFSDDLLSSLVNGSGTTYTFNNGVFGQTNTVKIGTRTLVTNTYSNDRNRYLTKSTYGNGNYISYTYDSHGRTTKVGYEDNANAILYEFDSEGRLGLVKDNLSSRTRTLLYDLSGRSVGYTETGDDHDLSVSYSYDGLNNVSTRTEKLNGTTYTSSYTYDRDSRVTAISNGTSKAANTYDSLSRLTKVLSKNGNSTVITTNIGYSSALVNSWSNAAGGTTDSYSYTYDSHGNITQITSGGNTTHYFYNEFDELIRENNEAANKTWVYTYDKGGNITSKTEYAYTTLADPVNPLSTKTFTYGNSSWKDLLTKIGTTTVTTDTIGNMTSDGEWTYTWKHGRQLSGMSKTGHTLSFSYDADGLRTTKTVSGTTTKYIYIGGQLTDVTKGNTTLHIDYDSVGPASVKFNGTYFWYLRNAQGDVTGIVDSSGTRVVTYTYDAWGNILNTGGSMAGTLGAANPLRYRGYVYDSETGLYYLQSRYYDPEICRFINADGYASTGQGLLGGNAFAYCKNNPVREVDTEGTVGCAIIGLLVGGFIGGISSAANGDGFLAGFLQGAISGGIAGLAVDVALWTGGTAGILLGIVGFGGAGGSIAGDLVYSGITETEMNWTRSGAKAMIAGLLNMASFGFSSSYFNKNVDSSFAKYMFMPTMSDISSTVITGNIGSVGAITNSIIDGVCYNSKHITSLSTKTTVSRTITRMHGGKGLVMMRE